MINPWLQWLLGACALIITVASLLVGYGRDRGQDAGALKRIDERLDDMDGEIKELRLWRHDMAKGPQIAALLPEVLGKIERKIERLESRVFNGGPR